MESQPPSERINSFKQPSQQQPVEKVNPFKELPRPQQPQVHKEKPKDQSSQPKQPKEITIKIRPWKMVKSLFIVVLLLAVFLAGRFSVGENSLALPSFSDYFDSDAGPSGLVTGDTKGAEDLEASQVDASKEAAVEEPAIEETAPVDRVSPATETVPAVEEVKAEETEQVPEVVIDESYSKVTLSLDGVYKDWKGTWGKIIGVKYTIINNEAGTIKPHHFVMIVEGYDEIEKHFDVSYTSQKIKADQTLSDEAAVSGGFAYSAVQIPDSDLTKVRISLFLLDADSETIASTVQDVNLQGE